MPRRPDGRIPVGFNDDWALTQVWSVPSLAASRIALDAATQAAMGSTIERLPLYWSSVQRVQGTMNWSTWDQLIAGYAARGIKVLLNISAAPFWARDLPYSDCGGSCQNVAPALDRLPDLRAFVSEVVQRYGQKLAGVEIYNEPNLAHYWQVNPVDPAYYTQILCAGYAGVQDAAAATGVRVPVGGGVVAANQSSTNGDMAMPVFLSAMMRDGAGSCMDALSFHPYPGSTDLTSPGSQFRRAFAQVRTIRDAYAPGMRLWVSETGLPLGPFSENDQTTTLPAIYRTIEAMPQGDVDMVIFHTLVGGGGYALTAPVTTGNGLALSPHPAYYALQSLLGE